MSSQHRLNKGFTLACQLLSKQQQPTSKLGIGDAAATPTARADAERDTEAGHQSITSMSVAVVLVA